MDIANDGPRRGERSLTHQLKAKSRRRREGLERLRSPSPARAPRNDPLPNLDLAYELRALNSIIVLSASPTARPGRERRDVQSQWDFVLSRVDIHDYRRRSNRSVPWEAFCANAFRAGRAGSSMVRAGRSERSGCRFESCPAHHAVPANRRGFGSTETLNEDEAQQQNAVQKALGIGFSGLTELGMDCEPRSSAAMAFRPASVNFNEYAWPVSSSRRQASIPVFALISRKV